MEERGILLKNLSSAGTWVNGRPTQDSALLKAGATIGLGSTPDDKTPALVFQLVETLFYDDDAEDSPDDCPVNFA